MTKTKFDASVDEPQAPLQVLITKFYVKEDVYINENISINSMYWNKEFKLMSKVLDKP